MRLSESASSFMSLLKTYFYRKAYHDFEVPTFFVGFQFIQFGIFFHFYLCEALLLYLLVVQYNSLHLSLQLKQTNGSM